MVGQVWGMRLGRNSITISNIQFGKKNFRGLPVNISVAKNRLSTASLWFLSLGLSAGNLEFFVHTAKDCLIQGRCCPTPVAFLQVSSNPQPSHTQILDASDLSSRWDLSGGIPRVFRNTSCEARVWRTPDGPLGELEWKAEADNLGSRPRKSAAQGEQSKEDKMRLSARALFVATKKNAK